MQTHRFLAQVGRIDLIGYLSDVLEAGANVLVVVHIQPFAHATTRFLAQFDVLGTQLRIGLQKKNFLNAYRVARSHNCGQVVPIVHIFQHHCPVGLPATDYFFQ